MSSNRTPQQHLDPTLRSVESQEFQAALRGKVVGQEEGVRALVDLYQVFCAGMSSTGRPVGNPLFLGPTGLWKNAHRGSGMRFCASGDPCGTGGSG